MRVRSAARGAQRRVLWRRSFHGSGPSRLPRCKMRAPPPRWACAEAYCYHTEVPLSSDCLCFPDTLVARLLAAGKGRGLREPRSAGHRGQLRRGAHPGSRRSSSHEQLHDLRHLPSPSTPGGPKSRCPGERFEQIRDAVCRSVRVQLAKGPWDPARRALALLVGAVFEGRSADPPSPAIRAMPPATCRVGCRDRGGSPRRPRSPKARRSVPRRAPPRAASRRIVLTGRTTTSAHRTPVTRAHRNYEVAWVISERSSPPWITERLGRTLRAPRAPRPPVRHGSKTRHRRIAGHNSRTRRVRVDGRDG